MDYLQLILILGLGYFLFKSYENIKFLNLEIDNLKNEQKDFQKDYNEKTKEVERSFNNVFRTLKTIPNVDIKIDDKVNTLISNRKKEIEDYVIESFSKVGKDILFERKMDEHRSTYISLNDILKNEKDKYSNYFNNVMSNMLMFKQDVGNSKKTIERINSNMSKKLKEIRDISKEHKHQFKQGIEARLEIMKKIESIDKRLSLFEKNSNSSTNYGNNHSSDSDDGFKVEEGLIKDISELLKEKSFKNLK